MGTDEHRVVDEAIAALGRDTKIYKRGQHLVRVLRDEALKDGVARDRGSLTISLLQQANLRTRLTAVANFTRVVGKDAERASKPVHPDRWLVEAVASHGEWPGVRALSAISDVPVLRRDGTVWQTPGYDAQTGVLFDRAAGFPVISDTAGLEDAKLAAATLMDVVCDFKFENADHKAAWLAALLTPLARSAFDGPSPLFLIDANIQGAGKSLLAQVIGEIILGRTMPTSSYAHDPDEMRKMITSLARAGDRMVHLDNLEGKFGNAVLDRALTSTQWKDRILGKNEQVDLPLNAVWYGTGNNVSIATETTRRIIHIRLDVLDEHPEERTGFKHPELIQWIRTVRPELVAAALTILTAYCKAGRPTQGLSTFGSFEGWSGLVREAVVWVGLPDPCKTRVGLSEASEADDGLDQLLEAWAAFDTENHGMTTTWLVKNLYAKTDRYWVMSGEVADAMRAALDNITYSPAGKMPTPRDVGNHIKIFRRRVIRGRYLDHVEGKRQKDGVLWTLKGTARA